jgi:hypothetical protein
MGEALVHFNTRTKDADAPLAQKVQEHIAKLDEKLTQSTYFAGNDSYEKIDH